MGSGGESGRCIAIGAGSGGVAASPRSVFRSWLARGLHRRAAAPRFPRRGGAEDRAGRCSAELSSQLHLDRLESCGRAEPGSRRLPTRARLQRASGCCFAAGALGALAPRGWRALRSGARRSRRRCADLYSPIGERSPRPQEHAHTRARTRFSRRTLPFMTHQPHSLGRAARGAPRRRRFHLLLGASHCFSLSRQRAPRSPQVRRRRAQRLDPNVPCSFATDLTHASRERRSTSTRSAPRTCSSRCDPEQEPHLGRRVPALRSRLGALRQPGGGGIGAATRAPRCTRSAARR